MSREVQETIEWLVGRGWRVELGGKHYKCYWSSRNSPVMVVSRTPSCGRAMKNVKKMALRIETGITQRIERKEETKCAGTVKD